MQDTGTVAGAAHARIADAHHVAHALFYQFGGDGHHAPLRHAGATLGPCIAQDHDVVFGDVEVQVVHGFFQAGVVVKHHGRAGVFLELGGAGAGFDHAAIGGQVALEHRQRALLVDGLVQ